MFNTIINVLFRELTVKHFYKLFATWYLTVVCVLMEVHTRHSVFLFTQLRSTDRACRHGVQNLKQRRHVFQQVCVLPTQEIVGKLHHFVLNNTTARVNAKLINIIIKLPSKRHVTHTHTHNRFTALFLGLPGWAGARRNLLLDFVVQGKTTDHPAGRHSIRTNQRLTSIIPHFYAGCPSCLGGAVV